MNRWRSLFLLALAALLCPGCGPTIDLKQSAHLVDVTTGWFDAGVQEDGKNKLVPSVTFRIKNEGSATIGSTQLNLIFKRVVDTDEWTTSFVKGIGSDGLAPGVTTAPLIVRAQAGYTGTQPRMTMLQNAQFVDFKVEVFAKHGSATWVKLGEYPITRQLLTE
jgi:hypothetical protein